MRKRFTRLILVRHGETEANREQHYIGRSHAALTEAGQVQAWQQDTSITPAGGEGTSAMHRRMCAARDRLEQTHLDQTIVLVSHIGPIKALLCAALAAPVSSLFRLSIDLASVSIIDWHPSLPRVRLINGHACWGLHPEMFIDV